MALLGATLGRPPLPCPSTSSSLPFRTNCFEFPLRRHPGVVARRRGAYPRIEATARHGTRKENAKVRNRRLQKKYNGTAKKPRMSVFCSNRQLYAMLVDDHGKKILFYASTLQEEIRGDPPCTTVEASRRVGEELVKACKELDISEVSCYDRNGFARGEKMMAFEDPVAQHGFLPR
ncbi:50S ribosomal protein L18, chloroplastic [Hordeum vulgare]|nr:50S ribosomal protein L18, chloroplastic [Hordeum vulgare]